MLQNVRSGFAALEKGLFQLVVARLDADRIGDAAYRDYILGLTGDGIGGFLLFGGARDEVKPFICAIQSRAAHPLFIASPAERGVGDHIGNATLFPSVMAFAAAVNKKDASDLALLKEALTAISLEARDCGVNMPLIPSPFRDNGFHDGDAGESPVEWVRSELRAAFLGTGLVPCTSHFPEDSIPQARPGQDGLRLGEAAWEAGAAIRAGMNLLLAPDDPRLTLEALIKALENGEVPRERVDEALAGVHAARLKMAPPLNGPVDYSRNEALSAEISQKAITLVKGRGRFLPVRDADAIPLIYAGDEEYFRSSALRYYVKQASHVMRPLPSNERPALFLLFPDRQGADMPAHGAPGEEESIKRLLRSTSPSIVAAFGSPSVLTRFKEADILIAAYDTSVQAQDAVFRAITGERPFSGQLPVMLSAPGPKGS
jgi:hypothetical protein